MSLATQLNFKRLKKGLQERHPVLSSPSPALTIIEYNGELYFPTTDFAILLDSKPSVQLSSLRTKIRSIIQARVDLEETQSVITIPPAYINNARITTNISARLDQTRTTDGLAFRGIGAKGLSVTKLSWLSFLLGKYKVRHGYKEQLKQFVEVEKDMYRQNLQDAELGIEIEDDEPEEETVPQEQLKLSVEDFEDMRGDLNVQNMTQAQVFEHFDNIVVDYRDSLSLIFIEDRPYMAMSDFVYLVMTEDKAPLGFNTIFHRLIRLVQRKEKETNIPGSYATEDGADTKEVITANPCILGGSSKGMNFRRKFVSYQMVTHILSSDDTDYELNSDLKDEFQYKMYLADEYKKGLAKLPLTSFHSLSEEDQNKRFVGGIGEVEIGDIEIEDDEPEEESGSFQLEIRENIPVGVAWYDGVAYVPYSHVMNTVGAQQLGDYYESLDEAIVAVTDTVGEEILEQKQSTHLFDDFEDAIIKARDNGICPDMVSLPFLQRGISYGEWDLEEREKIANIIVRNPELPIVSNSKMFAQEELEVAHRLRYGKSSKDINPAEKAVADFEEARRKHEELPETEPTSQEEAIEHTAEEAEIYPSVHDLQSDDFVDEMIHSLYDVRESMTQEEMFERVALVKAFLDKAYERVTKDYEQTQEVARAMEELNNRVFKR